MSYRVRDVSHRDAQWEAALSRAFAANPRRVTYNGRIIRHGCAGAYREGCRCRPCRTYQRALWNRRTPHLLARRSETERRNRQYRNEQMVAARRCGGELADLIERQERDRGNPSIHTRSLDARSPDDARVDWHDTFGSGPRHLVEWQDPTADAALADSSLSTPHY